LMRRFIGRLLHAGRQESKGMYSEVAQQFTAPAARSRILQAKLRVRRGILACSDKAFTVLNTAASHMDG